MCEAGEVMVPTRDHRGSGMLAARDQIPACTPTKRFVHSQTGIVEAIATAHAAGVTIAGRH